MPAVSRRQIVRSAKAKGWTIQPGPLAALERVLQQDDHLTVGEFLQQWIEPHMVRSQSRTITQEIWNGVVNEGRRAAVEGEGDDDDDPYQAREPATKKKKIVKDRGGQPQPQSEEEAKSSWNVVSAFHQPKLVYNTMRQQFRVEEKEWSLFGNAEEKVDMLAQRYALVHQRILRHEKFRPTSLAHLYNPSSSSNTTDGNNNVQFQIIPMEQLLGQRHQNVAVQHRSKTVLVLGLLREMDDCYYLEDPTGLVPISLQQAETSNPNLVLAEDSIYLVEGTWHDGTLIVIRLGPPLLESRHASLSAIHQQIQHPLFSLPSSTATSGALSLRYEQHLLDDNSQKPPLVILSDVHLDQPQVVQHLEGILAKYEARGKSLSYKKTPPPTFCLMGNFSSTPLSSRRGLQSLLQDELAATIRKFPHLAQTARFVLVPGPLDVPPLAVLPWSLPTNTKFHGVRHMIASTNPTRLYWHDNTEMVLFRALPQQLLDHERSVALPSALSSPSKASKDADDDAASTTSSSSSSCTATSALRLIKTMVDQGHMAPGAGVAPIYWNYDHALRLYPLPTCLVVGLGDSSSSSSFMDEPYGGCRIIAPGSLGHGGQYALYHPRSREELLLEEENGDSDDEEECVDKAQVQLLELAWSS